MDLYTRYGLHRVINAYDKATHLGGARVAPAVAQVVAAALQDCFRMEELQAAAGRALAAELSAEQRLRLSEEIRIRGSDFVAQEVVKLSTMPVWRDGYLEPRPFILRLFLTKVGDRWEVMPGGLCRIGDRPQMVQGACGFQTFLDGLRIEGEIVR